MGENKPDSTITMSYSAGVVSGTGISVGGLVGEGWGGSAVTACFWDTQISGHSASAGGAGKTTGEMQMAVTFLDAGWDFVEETDNGTKDIWWILEGQDTPRLWWDRYRKLTLSSGGHGSVTEPGEGEFTYERGTVVSIQAVADEDYQFLRWAGSAADVGRVDDPRVASTTVTADGDYTLEAVFAQTRTLTVSSGPNGSVGVPGEGLFLYGEGSVATVEAVPDPGYRLVRWTGTAVEAGLVANPLNPETEVIIGDDCALEALFVPFSSIYVDGHALGANDGTSWTNAYANLQDALGVALPGSEIRIAQGVYHPDRATGRTRGDRTAAFALPDGVTISGGYAGLAARYPNIRDVEAYETRLSGDLDDNDTIGIDPAMLMQDPSRAENSYHVLLGDARGNNTILDGLTIAGGHANGGGATLHDKGGGLYLYMSSPTLLDCMFIDNVSQDAGAGIYSATSSPTVDGCVFESNHAGLSGGAIAIEDGSNPRMTNCLFLANSARVGGGVVNGGGSSPVFTDCTFQGNFTPENGGKYGGGMHNEKGNPTLIGCMFTENSANDDDHGSGGGVSSFSEGITLFNCVLTGNTSWGEEGGAIMGSAKAINCLFYDNWARGRGGAIAGASLDLTNCTFHGNSAAGIGGGAIFGFASVRVRNTIFWGNSPNQLFYKEKNPFNVRYSCIQDGWPGTGNVTGDPMFVNSGGADYHLQTGSACSNRGDNAALPKDAMDLDGDLNTTEPIPWDFDGNPRIAGNVVDMGAYELPFTTGR